MAVKNHEWSEDNDLRNRFIEARSHLEEIVEKLATKEYSTHEFEAMKMALVAYDAFMKLFEHVEMMNRPNP